MAQYREHNFPGRADSSISALVSPAGRYVRVKITGAQNADGSFPVGLCGANDLGIGVLDNQEVYGTGAPVNIWLLNDCKTKIMQAAGAITVNTLVFAAASGQIAQTGTVVCGIALETASNAGDFIEVLPIVSVAKSAGGNTPPTVLTGTTDAISPHLSATYMVATAGVDAMTIAAPTAGTDDGVEISVISGSTNAHTVTFTGSTLNDGSTTQLTATFAAHPGASMNFVAYNAKWYLKGGAVGVTFT